MLKEAFKYLVDLGNTEVKPMEIDGRIFSPKELHPVRDTIVNAISVSSLSGLVDYVKSEFDGDIPFMIHVVSPTKVQVFTQKNRDSKRNFFIEAEAMTPSIRFDNWYDAENFNIKLQSCFVKNEDRDIMLRIIGNIREESVKTVGDDGISQAVTAKTGVATVDTVKVPNPVALKPYRTFVEVDQPESDFVFRMQSGPRCALFEADGGAWELTAMNNIKGYLEERLANEITKGRVHVIA